MVRRDKLIEKARAKPAALTFGELERLLSGAGWRMVRQSGSHRVWRAPDGTMVPIQPNGKQAKAYQVRQCLKIIGDGDGQT